MAETVTELRGSRGRASSTAASLKGLLGTSFFFTCLCRAWSVNSWLAFAWRNSSSCVSSLHTLSFGIAHTDFVLITPWILRIMAPAALAAGVSQISLCLHESLALVSK